MSKKFQIVKTFRGYREKTNVTNVVERDRNGRIIAVNGFLVKGSQNVISTDGDTIAQRKGYTLDGAANTATTPIESSFEWQTRRGVEIPLRSYDDELEFRTNVTGTVTWQKLADTFTSVAFNFDTVWDTTEGQDLLLFVNGTSSIFDWSGGITTFASATSNTITKQGTTSWAEEGFIANGTRRVIIEGTAYAYTGGEGTTTLTGVTPDPTGAGHTVGAIVHQQMRTNANEPSSSFNADLIKVLNNQVWAGATDNRTVFVSQVNSITDYTFSSPRVPGEGALLTLDGTSTALEVQDKSMFISAGKDQWYQSQFTLSDDITKEDLSIIRLKTTSQEAAISQGGVTKIKNFITIINNESTFDTLGRIENIDTDQSKPLSDPVKLLFDRLDFTNVHTRFHRNNAYIAVPNEGLVLIFNLEKGFWEAPQVLPIRRLAVIGGELYGHSNAVPETYKLFDGQNDNNIPINTIAKFNYHNFGSRVNLKNFDEFYSEGLISSNTKLTLKLNYDFEGFTTIKEFTINGSDDDILFQVVTDTSLGKSSLGKQPLGSSTDDLSDLPKFRQINTMVKADFFEIQTVYESNEIDTDWEIIAFGPNARISKNQPISVKK